MKLGKTSILIPLCLLSATVGPAFGNEPKPKIQMRDAPTHESLSRTLQAASNRDPMENIQTSDVPDPSKKSVPTNLVDRSHVISYNGLTTLIPKEAILALPESVERRIGKHVPGHRLVPWSEFITANRGWISTVEVTSEQAEGKTPMSEDAQKRIDRSTSLIVATFRGGPISVLPLKEPATEPEAATPTVEQP